MPRPPYQQIADTLREELEGGVYPPGEPLPPISTFQKRFGVANMTMRSAIGVLRNDGYVETQPGKGTYPVPAQARRLRVGPSAEAEIEDVRNETDPVEQARKATELLQLYDVRQRALQTMRRRAMDRAERSGMTRTQIAKGMGITKGRVTQLMEGIPAARKRSAAQRT